MQLEVGQEARGGKTECLHRRSVHERLQRGARLTERAGAVVLAKCSIRQKVGRADVRDDFARPIVDHEHRCRRDVVLFETADGAAGELFDLALQAQVQRRNDAVQAPAPESRLGRTAREGDRQVMPSSLDERSLQADGLGAGAFHGVSLGEAASEHAVENAIAARPHFIGTPPRVIKRRSARDRGEHRRLGEGELGSGLVEVEMTRGFDASDIRAEFDAAEVLFEDTILVERRFDAERERHFSELPGERSGPVYDGAGELLRQRAGAGHDAAVPDELSGRTHDGERVDSRVPIEPRIFGGEDRIRHRAMEVFERHRSAELAAVRTKLPNDPAVAVENAHARRCAAVLQSRRQRREGRGNTEGEERRRD